MVLLASRHLLDCLVSGLDRPYQDHQDHLCSGLHRGGSPWVPLRLFKGSATAEGECETGGFKVLQGGFREPLGAGLNISGLGGLDKAYQDHSKGSLEDVWKLSRPLKWS